MKTRSELFLSALIAFCLLAAFPRPAAAYVDVTPPTLGALCNDSVNIYVLQVEKASAEKGVILFRCVEKLKGKPDPTAGKHIIPATMAVGGEKVATADAIGPKLILDWATEGKKAILFTVTRGDDDPGGAVKGVGHAYIDNFWYTLSYNQNGKCWVAFKSELSLLTRYCGPADQFGDALTKILRGEEVMVPAMVGDNRQELQQRRAKVQTLRASLAILDGASKPNPNGNKKPDENKPAEKKPDEKKPDPNKPDDAKPEKKPAEKVSGLLGVVKEISQDGKTITLVPSPTEKNKEPAAIAIQMGNGTTITAGKAPGMLAIGQTVTVILEKGDAKIAAAIQVGNPGEQPVKKPAPVEKPAKPDPNGTETKPEEPKKPKEPAKPRRDPAPTSALIDAEIDRQLAKVKIPASPEADDAEFLRRVTLDLTGRIPTCQQAIAFLDSKEPDKRRKLIDQLLDSSEYGEHQGAIWRTLLVKQELSVTGKGNGSPDTLRPWLAEQFNDNRGWDAIVRELLTAEGTSRDNPATAFLLSNGENGRPQPNKVTGAVAALFWGVNLRCAECHNHPFAQWKQTDFWGTAVFFAKLGSGGGKGGPASLMESLVAGTSNKEKGGSGAPTLRGAAIVIPVGSGKSAGQVVKARFLGGLEPTLDEKEPFRPTFATWATAADNPYFARAAVNRMWAHFFGRGFVHPLDAFDTASPSHPELLDRLTKEFTASGFDLKHLARSITTSKAYQRTSRPVAGNENDTVAFSHMAVKVLTPEVLYDAMGMIGKASGNTGGNTGGKGSSGQQETRDLFLRSFRIDEDAGPTDYIQGIPQMLRLMNASSPNRGAVLVDQLCRSGASRPEVVTTLYLTVLSRRPSAEEVELMSGYLSRRKDDREGYRGVLWILLNSSEFTLNH